MGRHVGAPQLAAMLGTLRTDRPGYLELADAVRQLIDDGRLGDGVRLPAERELAAAMGVSRTMVTAAYRELRAGRYITSRRGAGSFTSLAGRRQPAARGLWSAGHAEVIDLACAALPAPPELLEAVRVAGTDLALYTRHSGYLPLGLPVLRERIAEKYTARGVATMPEQIIVTAGSLHSLHLVLKLLAGPGEKVLVESPTYPNALALLDQAGARLVTCGLGPAGWDGAQFLDMLAQAQPRLAYLIPDFHNPTGHVMPAQLREQLVAVSRATHTDLVVDETLVDLHLDGGPVPPPFASFDRNGRVLSIGSMSKAFWGGLRVGWIRTSAQVVQQLAAVAVDLGVSCSILDQLIAARLLESAATVVANRRAELAAQRDALVAALHEHLPEWRFRIPSGGISVWAELDAPVSSHLVKACEEVGVRLAGGPRFGAAGTLERFLRLPFTRPAPELEEAVRRIAAARAHLDARSRPYLTEPAVLA
ncbi:PLP-dependent aminotransferase family protein [Streptomyces ficellus]|uniref:PLP-dependent aminotransferase family protein n=1 Tax=Streptomyces ficellus TaxID=1977088 RepID=A0ABT7Z639_9ACTN|nr:PLP-dependent aminotransferase family protein [Streptomyces ficellus]MDN3294964.1 PLP-dependent aminotransferase family protein [Streptomyces ficellus]